LYNSKFIRIIRGENIKTRQKVESVRRERTKAGTIKVKNGKGVFDEKGKLKIPVRKKTAKELNEEFAKKNPAKAREIETLVKRKEQAMVEQKKKTDEPEIPLEPVPTEYQKFAQVDFIQNQTQRNALMRTIDEVQKIEGLTLTRDKEGCLTIHSGRKKVAKLIPYKKLWSFEKNDGKTVRPKPEEAIRLIREQMNGLTKQPVAETKASV
jgi:hypothetical protein